MKVGLEWANIVQLMQKDFQWSRVDVIRNKHSWSTPLDHKTCFGSFCNVWVHLVPYRYRTILGAKQAELEQLCEDSFHEVALEFFIMNAPNPRHWTLNSCFTVFSTVRLYLGLFLYFPKQGAKGAELVQLMQNFVPCRNFSKQSQLNCTIGLETQIFVHFVMLGCIWYFLSLHETRCSILMQKFVPQSHLGFLQRMSPIHAIVP